MRTHPNYGPSRFGYYAHRMGAWIQARHYRDIYPDAQDCITPFMWGFTVFDGDRPFDDEILGLIEMERAIGDVPDWAIDIALQIDALPHCGQVNFPEPLYAVFRGIGREEPDPGYTFCFEASSATKDAVEQRLLALDRWLDGATVQDWRRRFPDVSAFVEHAYSALGASTDLKRVAVERMAWHLRFLNASFTTNDGGLLSIDMNAPRPWTPGRPETGEREEIERRLREAAEDTAFDVDRFISEFDHPWLCHQRLFDQINATLARIGREESAYDWDEAVEAAKPTAEEMCRVYDVSMAGITAWAEGDEPDGGLRDAPEADAILSETCDRLGPPTDVKLWLALALRKKIERFRIQEPVGALAV
ncbi:hypothetical protein CMK11_15335 [Candidatus Poribacteria bacterium]|nr:hypothetical protein [Candidatus Poribacteria bacterium]